MEIIIKYFPGDKLKLPGNIIENNFIDLPKSDDGIYYLKYFFADIENGDDMFAAIYKENMPNTEYFIPVEDLIESTNLSNRERNKEEKVIMPKYNVGDKFVIEIDKVYDTDSEGKSVYKMKGFDSLVMTDFGLDKLKELNDIETVKEEVDIPPYNIGDIIYWDGDLYFYNGYYVEDGDVKICITADKDSVGKINTQGIPYSDYIRKSYKECYDQIKLVCHTDILKENWYD